MDTQARTHLRILRHEFERGKKEMFEEMKPYLCFTHCEKERGDMRELTKEQFYARRKT